MSEILVVDDDQHVLELLREMLQLEGHDVVTAQNGRIAVDLLGARSFDLVITDLIMPEKEGLETITDMRNLKADLPIIAISGGGRIGPVDYLATAKFVGANATLAKPFARDELLSVVADLLSSAAE